MIDHSGHPHPATPAARALCRANGGTGDITKKATSSPRTKTRAKTRSPGLTEARVPVASRTPSLPKPQETTKTAKATENRRKEQESRIRRIAERQRQAGGQSPVVKGNNLIETQSDREKAVQDIQRISGGKTYGSAFSIDGQLTAISKMQGWHGKPRVVSKEEMDRLVAAGAPPLYRGVKPAKTGTPKDFFDSLRGTPGSAEYELGTGVYGNGVYFSDSRDTATHFATKRGVKDPNEGIIRGMIDPNARSIDYDKIKQMARDELTRLEAEEKAKGLTMKDTPEEWKKSREQMGILIDPGRYAALLGYDVIDVGPQHDDGYQKTLQRVVLNRTVLILEDVP